MLEKINWYAYKIKKTIQSHIKSIQLNLRNKYSKEKITGSTNAVICLTSYGKRINSVHLAIESIGQGTKKPSQIILWLDDHNAYNTPTKSIKRLINRGLTIKLTKNYGPHTKYFPYVSETISPSAPLITADDDMLYPKNWLEILWGAYNKSPNSIHCMRARVMDIENNRIRAFKHWKFLDNAHTSPFIFFEGVSGVIYPPKTQSDLKNNGTNFLTICPKHDDVWLNLIALRNNTPIRQVNKKAAHYPEIPGTIKMGLMNENTGEAGDNQIRTAFTDRDIQKIKQKASNNEYHTTDK